MEEMGITENGLTKIAVKCIELLQCLLKIQHQILGTFPDVQEIKMPAIKFRTAKSNPPHLLYKDLAYHRFSTLDEYAKFIACLELKEAKAMFMAKSFWKSVSASNLHFVLCLCFGFFKKKVIH
ncbi:hypothetical protein AVEN_43682-1 [Araneus ventricosus]|uniref:Uncharacterized protein n=1 Tax=Araneus ventricosus TaxID=182803 RepID=A0A4Y2IZB0_ARAVE|nr:hypothetical protein AVEN_43682-1 [Araneus ventricosus]